MSITREDIMAFTQWQDGEKYYSPEDDYAPRIKGYVKDATKSVPKGTSVEAVGIDPYDDAPVVDDAYKQDFSEKYKGVVEGPITKMVREFINTTGQVVSVELYQELMSEEYMEWRHEASEMYRCEHNRYSATDELKELADLVYVIFGYAVAKGWNLDEAIKRVHKNNLERVIQEDGTIKRREDGKILKRENAPTVNLKDLTS